MIPAKIRKKPTIYRNSESKSVKRIFRQLFSKANPEDTGFHAELTDALLSCFHLNNLKLETLEHAELVLYHLFACFTASNQYPFDLSRFLRAYATLKTKRKLLIALLYGLYFKDIDLVRYQNQSHWENLEMLLLLLLAEKTSRLSLGKLLKKLPFAKQLALICYAFKNYREGAYIIISEFESFKSPSKKFNTQFRDLIIGMKSQYYDRSIVYRELDAHDTIDVSFLESLMRKLKEHARRQAKKLQTLFHALVPLMVDSPVTVFDAIEDLKQSLPGGDSSPTKNHERTRPQEQQKMLHQKFSSYLNASYDVKDFDAFAKIFGFTGQYPFLKIMGKQIYCGSLIKKVQLMLRLFREPLTVSRLPHYEVVALFDFALAIASHLEAVSRNPHALSEGLDVLSCAIATNGKLLSEQASLPTLLKGVHKLANYIGKTSIENYPIFVFDQSLPALFEKNRRFIARLTKEYKNPIIHVSKAEALDLAKKVGIEPLLNTTRNGNFGYGGARNSTFLLTPILRAAYKKGALPIANLLKMEPSALNALFLQGVLGRDGQENSNINSVLIVDDDMEIPESNILSHLLFASSIRHVYTSYCGFCYGRGTKYSLQFPFLCDVLQSPTNSFAFTEWVDLPFYAPMPQYIGKPKVCLNLPFGHEENDVIIPWTVNPMLQGAYHLGGTRYPAKQIPTHWIVGLDQHLKSYLPYALGIYLKMDLIDPSNTSSRSILPWNDALHRAKSPSLKQCFELISNDCIKEELQKRYWINVNKLFNEPDIPLRHCIDDLIHTDVDAILTSFRSKNGLLGPIEASALKGIGNIYKFYQKDAQIFMDFGKKVLNELKRDSDIVAILERIKANIETQRRIRLADYPLSYGFYLTCRSAGAGEFSDIIKNIIKINTDN